MDSIFSSSCLCPFSQSELDDILCTPEEVEHLLLRLDVHVSKASGPDLVSACMLKNTPKYTNIRRLIWYIPTC